MTLIQEAFSKALITISQPRERELRKIGNWAWRMIESTDKGQA